MAVFYVLPPKEHFEHAVAEFLKPWLPGCPVGPEAARALLAAVVGEPADDSSAFVVHREELPGLGDAVDDLVIGFGAECGDEAIEIVREGSRITAKRHRIPGLGIPELRRG